MNRSIEKVSQRWSNTEISHKEETSSAEESSSRSNSIQYSPQVKNTSTPSRSRILDLESINRSRQEQRKSKNKNLQELSSDERYKLSSVNRGRYQGDRGRIVEKHKRRHSRHGKFRSDNDSEETENEERKTLSDSETSEDRYGDSDAENAKKKKKESAKKKRALKESKELPITEILRKSQEKEKTKYEPEPPLPVLTTNKMYVQHRGGFSVVKINQKADSRGESEKRKPLELDEKQSSPPIKVAIVIQQFWTKTGLLYQGLLAGMALMHFLMLYIFFNSSVEFLLKYSLLNDIYTTIFSCLIVLCIVSTFDKFDLARFDVDHLRELYMDYNRAIIAVPLYLIVFCLHQICSGMDNQLNLIHYYSNNHTTWDNVTNVEVLLNNLDTWQKITLSKDILTLVAWVFISLGNKEDAFLMYLRSMKTYVNDVESVRRD